MKLRAAFAGILAAALALSGLAPSSALCAQLPGTSTAGRLQVPSTVPALGLFNSDSMVLSAWPIALLEFARYVDSHRGATNIPGFEDFAQWARFLDPQSLEHNPGLLAPVVSYLDQYGEKADIEHLRQLAGAGFRGPQLPEVIARLRAAREAASTSVASAIVSIEIGRKRDDFERVADFLGALQASGIYNREKIAVARARALGVADGIAANFHAIRDLGDAVIAGDAGGSGASRAAAVTIHAPVVISKGPELSYVAQSEATREAFRQAKVWAGTDKRILITGETGTGKEVLARYVHANSRRAGKPFKGVNVAAISPRLLESEIFGHVKGAFTGADKDRPGLLELAEGGTLFLDEIADLPKHLQIKLVSLLEHGTYDRVGAPGEKRRADVRFESATNRDLRPMIDEDKFLPALFYLLQERVVEMPPLRRRADEIPAMVAFFLKQIAEKWAGSGSAPPSAHEVSDAAMHALEAYAWPGNVRELRDAIEYGLIMAQGKTIELEDLPPAVCRAVPAPAAASTQSPSVSGDTALGKFIHALDQTRGLSFISAASRAMLKKVQRVAARPSTVVVSGPTGAGKSATVRVLHDLSGRTGPYVDVTIAGRSEDLIESELFGHVRGAFTDAKEDRKGYFEIAEDGTLVLDHIDELSLELQAKLLRVLQELEFTPVGSHTPIKFRARVVAIARKPLAELVAKKKFREDLYHRLNVFGIEVAPLRDRPEEILLLSEKFLQAAAEQMPSRGPAKRFSEETIAALLLYDWPGNIRELESEITNAYVSANGSSEILPVHFGDNFRRKLLEPSVNVDNYSLEDVEKRRILLALLHVLETEGVVNISVASRMLEIQRSTLYRYLEAYTGFRTPTPHELRLLAKAWDVRLDERSLPENWSLKSAERDHIIHVLRRHAYIKSQAASVLKITRSTLDRKIRLLKIPLN